MLNLCYRLSEWQDLTGISLILGVLCVWSLWLAEVCFLRALTRRKQIFWGVGKALCYLWKSSSLAVLWLKLNLTRNLALSSPLLFLVHHKNNTSAVFERPIKRHAIQTSLKGKYNRTREGRFFLLYCANLSKAIVACSSALFSLTRW